MATAETITRPLASTRVPQVADYVELTKPKIAVMALVTVAVGYLLGAAPSFNPEHLIHTLIGAGLVAAGGSALNHWLERRADARMARTATRPLPSGRVSPSEAVAFGITLAVVGIGYLVVALPSPAAAIAAGLTFALYVVVYTPLKTVTAWNTVVGAVPGALPPVIGWCAARGNVSAEGWVLFAILFAWQLPHFFAIAWMYREDYARGGMVMLPSVDRHDGRLTGVATALTCGLLLLATLAPFPFLTGPGAWVYLAGSVPLGLWFLARSARFAFNRSYANARSVLRGSLVYLVGMMGLLVLTGVVPRYW